MHMRGMGRNALVWPLVFAAACGGAADEPTPEAAPEAPAATATPAGLLNPNLADANALADVPGMTPEAAQAIADGGPYLTAASFDDALRGQIGEAAGAAYAHVWLPINLNDVTEAEILLIPGMDDRMAHEFEEYRPYADMAEFRQEIGKYVDEEEVERLAQYVYVPIDLNTATRDEIMAVPGMDDRMAHEFEEYRPYTSLDQFRQEMGKYVDENEVARFERYVTIR